jgi:hypothetical protein
VDRDDVVRQVGSNLLGYYLAKVFSRADASEQEERIGSLEMAFFQVLEHTDRPARIVFEALAHQPELFVQLVGWIFREDTDEEAAAETEEFSEGVVKRASGADALLRAWHGYPGDDAAGAADRESALVTWAGKALDLAVAERRAGTGAAKVAEVLVRAPNGEDGAWPALAVRDLLECGRYPTLGRHVVVAERNTLGTTSRGYLDGGDQERDMATQYRKWSEVVRAKWPRTAAVLDELAAGYEHEGRRHDEGVAADRIRYGD